MASATADWRAAFLEAAAAVVEEDVGADGACKKERRFIVSIRWSRMCSFTKDTKKIGAVGNLPHVVRVH